MKEEVSKTTEPAKSTEAVDEFEDDLDALEALAAAEVTR